MDDKRTERRPTLFGTGGKDSLSRGLESSCAGLAVSFGHFRDGEEIPRIQLCFNFGRRFGKRPEDSGSCLSTSDLGSEMTNLIAVASGVEYRCREVERSCTATLAWLSANRT